MTTGLVDSATVSQVVQCLDRGMTSQYPWSLRTVIDFTALLMREDHMALAPGLMLPKSIVVDNQDLLIDIMSSNGLIASLSMFDENTVHSATRRSKQWIGRGTHIAAVRTEVEELMADRTNFQNWIDWAAPNAWHAHSRRLGGLFDGTYLPYVAHILDISVGEALHLHSRSTDPKEISRLVAVRNQDFEQMTRAYVASSIIRGRYHDEVARLEGLQLTRHPLRGMVAKMRTGRAVAEIQVPLAATCLACIVIYGAVKQRRLEDRLRCWVDNVRRVRGLLARGGLQLTESSGHAAIDAALLLARHAGVQIVDSRVDTFLEVMAGLGLGILTGVFLTPWLGIPIGVGVSRGLKKARFPGRVRNVVAYHVGGSKLKQFAAGRIETEWSRADNNE